MRFCCNGSAGLQQAAVLAANQLRRLRLAEARYRRGDRTALLDFHKTALAYLQER